MLIGEKEKVVPRTAQASLKKDGVRMCGFAVPSAVRLRLTVAYQVLLGYASVTLAEA